MRSLNSACDTTHTGPPQRWRYLKPQSETRGSAWRVLEQVQARANRSGVLRKVERGQPTMTKRSGLAMVQDDMPGWEIRECYGQCCAQHVLLKLLSLLLQLTSLIPANKNHRTSRTFE